MRKPRIDGQETRQRLLAAAGEVFAAMGFWETTNAAICARAGANAAAVNYHFGSKEELYVAAWKYAFGRSTSSHPPDGGVSPAAPIEQRLRGRILSFLRCGADREAYDLEILFKETACPTGLLTEAMAEAAEPIRQGFESLIREVLGPRASRQQLLFCQMSVMSLCFGPLQHLRHARMTPAPPRPRGFPRKLDLERFADHAARFILAGLEAIRREAAR